MRSREEIKEFLKSMNRFDGTMQQRAHAFAEFAHEGQLDKYGQEYIQHPVRVANNVDRKFNNPILTSIAFMHDVIEEGNLATSDLMPYFPDVVWKCVDILTRRKSLGRDDYIKLVGENFLACQIKLVDLEDNMDESRITYRSEKDYTRQERYKNEYNYLFDRLREFNNRLTPEEMEPELYAELYM